MEQGRSSLRGAARGTLPGVRPGTLEADLLRALDRREIEVLFQPQFASISGAVVGAEALARWRAFRRWVPSGRAQICSPLPSVPRWFAPLSRHVVARALEDAGTWPDNLTLSLNINARGTGRSALCRRFRRADRAIRLSRRGG